VLTNAFRSVILGKLAAEVSPKSERTPVLEEEEEKRRQRRNSRPSPSGRQFARKRRRSDDSAATPVLLRADDHPRGRGGEATTTPQLPSFSERTPVREEEEAR